MFEKEAEERYKQHLADPNYYENSEEESYLRGFGEGAEFAYNKANKWHDLIANPNDLPKEELKLPSECKNYYVVWFGKNNFSGAKFINGKFYDGEFVYYPDEIVAWKEIVLPELKESE